MKQFKEKQRFRKLWLWIILSGITVVSVIRLYRNVKQVGFHDINTAQVVMVVIPVLLVVFLLVMTLQTKIDSTGVYYRFFPIHIKWKKKEWAEIRRVYMRIYLPFGEFGGWGIRYSAENGRALNVSGNQGLQLELKNGQKLLLGTQRSEELQQVLNELSVAGIIKAGSEEGQERNTDRF